MKLKFNYNVPDKHTGKVYVAGETYEFEEKRAKEILSVVNRDTGLPFAKEVKEEITEEEGKLKTLEEMTIKELKELAESQNIEITTTKKEDIIKEIQASVNNIETNEEDINEDTNE